MFWSLRSKLVASYCFVIFLCLLLAGTAFVYLLRDQQRQIRLNQLSDLALPISWQVRLLERSGASQKQIALFLQDQASEMNVRILLVDPSGLVVEDTEKSLMGGRIQTPLVKTLPDRYSNPVAVIIERVGPQSYALIAASGHATSPPPDRFDIRSSSYTVLLAVPEQSLAASWLELAPSLSFAALVSLIVSFGVALILSRSISKPVMEITRASEEMAQGNYDQHIQVRSKDEVGRLAEAFNDMARQVSTSHRTLRDFLANVSHELRTPLTSVQGFSQALLDGTVKSTEERIEAVQIINEESNRMRRMVEDLLLLSKIESGQLPMSLTSLDVRELLKACVKRTMPKAQQKDVLLTLEADQSAVVSGDEGRLEEVFQNLLDNALSHTPQGGSVNMKLVVTKSVAAVPRGWGRKDGKHLESQIAQISVHNTGSYIPQEDQPRVFERFYQVDKSRARNGDGMGLGLAIAWEIVHAHGGNISVKSSPETGTTFIVSLACQPPATGLSSNNKI